MNPREEAASVPDPGQVPASALPTAATPAVPALPPVATPASTRVDLARLSARGYTVIRNVFVQVRVGDQWTGSSLGRLVAARQPRALSGYLLLLMSWSALDRREVPIEAGVWARALSPAPPASAWAPAAMTRVWSALEEHGLVTKERQGRRVRITPRREDGRRPYERPRPDQSTAARERYFIVPDAFWLDGWHERLTFAGVATLLMLLHDTTGRDEVRLPYERVQAWYGISPKTLQNGLDDLRRHRLLAERREWVAESLSAIGRTQWVHYRLTGPFARDERQRLQKAAGVAARARAAKLSRRRAASGTGATPLRVVRRQRDE